MGFADTIAARAAALQRIYVRTCERLGAALISAVLVITSVQVFDRYFLNDTPPWAEELCRALLIWTCFLFAGIAFQRGEMAAVTMLTNLLPRRLRALVLVPAYLLTCAFLVSMVYFGWLYAQRNLIQTVPGLDLLLEQLTGSTAGVPIFWIHLAVPVGCLIPALHVFASAVRIAADAWSGRTAGA
jgi:TRAP-type C4-dicarboxylate transport system permease small subunit